jgi:hypothetical protein
VVHLHASFRKYFLQQCCLIIGLCGDFCTVSFRKFFATKLFHNWSLGTVSLREYFGIKVPFYSTYSYSSWSTVFEVKLHGIVSQIFLQQWLPHS